jgi:THUMP domain-containing protein/uncharacterized protein
LNKELLNKNVQSFILQNLNEDTSKLILKGSPFQNISIQDIVKQIISKKKCKKKLPSWFNTEDIYYPNKINIEQTSSETTAEFKANLIDGNSLFDITGGFGVDCYYFSKKIKKVIHCEMDTDLSEIVSYNFSKLQTHNIETVAQNGLDYLGDTKEIFGWIYADPSRRDNKKGKVFLLDDCTPNIPLNLDYLFNYTDHILLKLSPILDISSSINELHSVKEIHIVAVKNEVKELLFILQKGYKNKINIKTINIGNTHNYIFNSTINSTTKPTYSLPKTYLYEPNASILKAGLFNQVSHELNINKLHVNSHLYTFDTLINFPGRRFEINNVIPYNKKQLKKLIPEKRANITTRNFPETVADIRKKTGLKDGGDLYLFFTTNINNKHIILICSKIM